MDTSAGSLGTRSRDPISGALLVSSGRGSDRRDAGAAEAVQAEGVAECVEPDCRAVLI